jgi:hypothetical protein
MLFESRISAGIDQLTLRRVFPDACLLLSHCRRFRHCTFLVFWRNLGARRQAKLAVMAAKVKAASLTPCCCRGQTDRLPDDGARWEYQLKFDG